ncbi:hypothetical protein SAMN04487910_1691 [Aquimarina amphilecti]|uniref:Uncharacterized protein n=1 Tax=Aquimarina amphilecti TaxID=1038014 RepID=A0A1H7MCZ3_AQUAM|nr:hypothetical protein SAMN04487910_1691 [Aquimarina amphilecti]
MDIVVHNLRETIHFFYFSFISLTLVLKEIPRTNPAPKDKPIAILFVNIPMQISFLF